MNEQAIVIVLDLGNYTSKHSEQVPFKAKVLDIYDDCVLVESIATGNEYELYFSQILEGLLIEEIRAMIDMNQYGKTI